MSTGPEVADLLMHTWFVQTTQKASQNTEKHDIVVQQAKRRKTSRSSCAFIGMLREKDNLVSAARDFSEKLLVLPSCVANRRPY